MENIEWDGLVLVCVCVCLCLGGSNNFREISISDFSWKLLSVNWFVLLVCFMVSFSNHYSTSLSVPTRPEIYEAGRSEDKTGFQQWKRTKGLFLAWFSHLGSISSHVFSLLHQSRWQPTLLTYEVCSVLPSYTSHCFTGQAPLIQTCLQGQFLLWMLTLCCYILGTAGRQV